MKKIFSTKMINTGGRNGEVHSPDKSFNLDIIAPGRKVEGATNPEQLFAAGYSACFNSALDYIKKSKNIEGESTIEVTVSLYNLSCVLIWPHWVKIREIEKVYEVIFRDFEVQNFWYQWFRS